MSHFPIAVLVPKILQGNHAGIEKFIEAQLDPFDEMSDEEWAAQVKSITEKYAEEFVGVIVDCHI